MSVYSYNSSLGGMGGGIDQFTRNQKDRLSLSQQIAPNPDELHSQVATAGQGVKDALDFSGDVKDFMGGLNEKRQAITKAQSVITGAAGAVRQGANSALQQAGSIANYLHPNNKAFQQLAGGGGNGTPNIPAHITPNSAGILPPNAKQGLLDTETQHNAVLDSMSSTDKTATMATIHADPVAGGNFKGAGMAYNDRAGVLNARTRIIGDTVNDINARPAGLVGNLGQDANAGLRVGAGNIGGMGGLNVNSMVANAGTPANNALGALHGASQDAQNAVGQARGGLANGANNLHSLVGGVASDVESGVADAQKVVSAGIGVGESVLDALGPVGDLLGLGLGIFGGVEEHHEKEVAEQSATTAQSQLQAPEAKTTQASVGGSLDTSHQAPASAPLHY